MLLDMIFLLLGGFGLFMYGLNLFSDGLQKSTEKSLKKVLSKITQNKFLGISFGTLITSIVQSSSAVTVMAVSFVNAGIMTLRQAIHVTLGANIGTTVTGWIIAMDIYIIALPSIAVGSMLFLFGKGKAKTFGSLIMGFGMLFYGMDLMTNSFTVVKNSEAFKNVLLTASASTYLDVFICIVIGAIATGIIQSSSAVVGIVISMATSGLIDYTAAIAIALGADIGTTVTANIASLNASLNAKRAAFVHFLFNLFGVIYIFILFPYYIALINWIVRSILGVSASNVAIHIVTAHTMFNFINVCVFYFLTGYLEKAACFVFKGKDEEKRISLLSDKLLDMPVSADIEVQKEVLYMGDLSKSITKNIKELFNQNKNSKILENINNDVETLKNTETDIRSFIIKLLPKSSKSLSGDLAPMITVSTYYENLGNNLKDLSEVVNKAVSNKRYKLTDNQKSDVIDMIDSLSDYLACIIDGMNPVLNSNKEDIAENTNNKCKNIKLIYNKVRDNHYKLIEKSEAKELNAYLFTDILVYFNRAFNNLMDISEVFMNKA